MSQDEQCEFYNTCEFFIYELTNKALEERFRQRYCDTLKTACARYMIYTECDQLLSIIPKRLYPNEYDKALEIIATHKKQRV